MGEMNYDAAKFWLEIVLFVINVGFWAFVWNSNKDKATKAQLEEHAIRLGKMDERLKASLSHTELAPVYERINSVDKQLGKIQGQMHTLDLIHELLLNKRGEG